jgi:Fe-S oxidoreductase
VGQIEVGTALRRIATEYGVYPDSALPVRAVAASLQAEGNPFHRPRSERPAWAAGLGVPDFEEGMEVLWFVGCYGSYDPRMRKAAAATVEVLAAAGVRYGILGDRESCCGEGIRRAGNEAAFRALARENIRAFVDRGVKRVLVSSPHCLHALRNLYPEFMVRFEVVHIAAYLAELMEAGRLVPAGEFRARVAWHDPCYLGRHNGIYEEPRRVLRSLPGLELVEFPESRRDSLCCGGGGGRIWMETPRGERLSDLRMAQARETGAAVLATACPYCISNFEESRLSLEGAPEVRDIAEVVRDALRAGGRP